MIRTQACVQGIAEGNNKDRYPAADHSLCDVSNEEHTRTLSEARHSILDSFSVGTKPPVGLMSMISGSGSRKSSRKSKSSRVEAGPSPFLNPFGRHRFFKFCWSSLLSVAENTNVCMGGNEFASSAGDVDGDSE